MVLQTAVEEKGLRLAVTPEPTENGELHEVPSESYLRVIEETVAAAGGWEQITRWQVDTRANSFTSIRGLITLVNTLAPLHGVPVEVQTTEGESATAATLPLEPDYHMEPNIGPASKG